MSPWLNVLSRSRERSKQIFWGFCAALEQVLHCSDAVLVAYIEDLIRHDLLPSLAQVVDIYLPHDDSLTVIPLHFVCPGEGVVNTYLMLRLDHCTENVSSEKNLVLAL